MSWTCKGSSPRWIRKRRARGSDSRSVTAAPRALQTSCTVPFASQTASLDLENRFRSLVRRGQPYRPTSAPPPLNLNSLVRLKNAERKSLCKGVRLDGTLLPPIVEQELPEVSTPPEMEPHARPERDHVLKAQKSP